MDAKEYQESAMATKAFQGLIHSRLYNRGTIEEDIKREQNGQGWAKPKEEPEIGSVADQLENRYNDPDYPHNCVFCKARVYKDAARKICFFCSFKINRSEIKS